MFSLFKKLFQQYKNIAKNSFYLSVVDGIKLLLPFVAMPYIIRVCGVENYGRIIFAQSVIAYFNKVVNFGLNIFTVRQVAKNSGDPVKLSRLASSFMAIRLALIALSFIVLNILLAFVPFLQPFRILLYCCFIAVLAEAFIMTAFFQGMEKMHNITILQSFSVIFYLATLLLLVKEEKDYFMVPLLQSTGLLISSLLGVALMRIRYHVKIGIPQKAEVWSMFKGSVPFAMSRIAIVINGNVAKLFVGIALGMHELAILDIAKKIAAAAMLPIEILDQAIYPHNARQKDRHFATNTFYLVLLTGAVCALLMYIGTPYAVKFFGHNQLNNAIFFTRILSIKVIFSAMNLYSGTPVLVAFGYPKPFNMSVIYTALLTMVIYPLFYFCGWLSLNMVIFIVIIDSVLSSAYRMYHCIRYKLLFSRGKKD